MGNIATRPKRGHKGGIQSFASLEAPPLSLSDTSARMAKPREKPYKLADGHGLYLEVAPNGSRYWRLKYRFVACNGHSA